jgi:hypothetical protein
MKKEKNVTTVDFITELFYLADEKLKERKAAFTSQTLEKRDCDFGFVVCSERQQHTAFLPLAAA